MIKKINNDGSRVSETNISVMMVIKGSIKIDGWMPETGGTSLVK